MDELFLNRLFLCVKLLISTEESQDIDTVTEQFAQNNTYQDVIPDLDGIFKDVNG